MVLKKRILGEMGHLSNEMAGKVIAYMAENGTKNFYLDISAKKTTFLSLHIRQF